MHLFAYGTLQFDEVWSRVTGVQLDALAGHVDDFAVYRMAGRVYPGMIPQSGTRAIGTVYFDLSAETIDRLDHFEGDEYHRQPVAAHCADGVTRICQAYLVPTDNKELLTDEPWTCQTFVENGELTQFLGSWGKC